MRFTQHNVKPHYLPFLCSSCHKGEAAAAAARKSAREIEQHSWDKLQLQQADTDTVVVALDMAEQLLDMAVLHTAADMLLVAQHMAVDLGMELVGDMADTVLNRDSVGVELQ
jgi:hypothetical protein